MTHRRFMEGAGFLCSILFLAGCGPSFQQLRTQGYAEMEAGNLLAARGLFKAALEKKPESADVLYCVARIYQAFGEEAFRGKNTPAAMREMDYALHYYDRAVEVYPGYDEALKGKARVLELRGQYGDAFRVAEWTVQNGPSMARQHDFLAKELEKRGDLDNALLRLRQAAKMEPNNPKAHLELGRFYLRNNQRESAAEEFQIAYALDPESTEIASELQNLGYEPIIAGKDLTETEGSSDKLK